VSDRSLPNSNFSRQAAAKHLRCRRKSLARRLLDEAYQAYLCDSILVNNGCHIRQTYSLHSNQPSQSLNPLIHLLLFHTISFESPSSPRSIILPREPNSPHSVLTIKVRKYKSTWHSAEHFFDISSVLFSCAFCRKLTSSNLPHEFFERGNRWWNSYSSSSITTILLWSLSILGNIDHPIFSTH